MAVGDEAEVESPLAFGGGARLRLVKIPAADGPGVYLYDVLLFGVKIAEVEEHRLDQGSAWVVL